MIHRVENSLDVVVKLLLDATKQCSATLCCVSLVHGYAQVRTSYYRIANKLMESELNKKCVGVWGESGGGCLPLLRG